MNDGNWHHVAVTRQSLTGEVRLYIDGVLDTTAFLSAGPRSSTVDFHIGANHTPAGLLFYTGSMDDVRLYADVLSAADIVALAYPPIPVIQSISLVGSIGLLGSSGSIVLHGTGGNPNAQFLVLGSTNLALPPQQWPIASTNDFDANGNFFTTNSTTVNVTARFFRLQLY